MSATFAPAMGETATYIGPYRIVKRLGVGGMAEAFEALREHDRGVAQRVCVKRLLPAYVDDAELLRLFEIEARTMASLAHGNVVGVLDVGTHEGAPYLVLELVDGIDLRALLSTAPGKRLDPVVARYVAYELARALAFAHAPDPPHRAHGVVHRDLSPSNVLIGRGGEVRLSDFGLAKAIASAPVTQSGAVRGKIPYMAPEHMRGAPIDGRADLFSLGVLLFECLAGTRPFDGTHEVETMTRILAGTRVDLAALRPELDPALVAVVERLLAADRDARPASANAVLEAIEAIGPVRKGRRALAKLVESRLGGPTTRAHVSPHLYFTPASPAPASEPVRVTEPARVTEAEAGPAAAPETAPARPTRAELGAEPTRHDAALPAMLERTTPGAPLVNASASSRPVATPPVARARRAGLAIAGVVSLVAMVALAVTRPWSAGRVPSAATPASDVRAPDEATPTQAPSIAAPPTAATTPEANVPEAPPAPGETPETIATDEASGARAEATVRVVVEPWGKVWVDGRLLGRAPRAVTVAPGEHRVEAGFDGPTHRRSVAVGAGETRVVRLDITPRE